ncbi:MAG TPA: hypothetical protein VGE50_02300 [Gammaproteobacteria bacterium]
MRLLLPLLILGTVLLNGCTDNIRGEDDHALFAEGEVVVGLGKVEPNDPKRRVNTLSAGYIRTEGDAEQDLSAYGDDIRVNGVTIRGPVTVENNLKLSVGYLRFVRHMFVTQGFEWHWGAGLGYSHVNYTGTTPNQQVNFIDSATGLHGQVGVAYHFNPQVAFEGVLGGYQFSGDHDTRLLTRQLVLVASPTDALRLFAGYRAWDYHFMFSADDPSNSDIDFYFAGPTVGATLSF